MKKLLIATLTLALTLISFISCGKAATTEAHLEIAPQVGETFNVTVQKDGSLVEEEYVFGGFIPAEATIFSNHWALVQYEAQKPRLILTEYESEDGVTVLCPATPTGKYEGDTYYEFQWEISHCKYPLEFVEGEALVYEDGVRIILGNEAVVSDYESPDHHLVEVFANDLNTRKVFEIEGKPYGFDLKTVYVVGEDGLAQMPRYEGEGKHNWKLSNGVGIVADYVLEEALQEYLG